MLKSTLVVIAVSIAAGATIRASAFAIFAFLVVTALGGVILLKRFLLDGGARFLRRSACIDGDMLSGGSIRLLLVAYSKAPEKELHH